MLVFQERTTAWHFIGSMDQNVLNIRMVNRNNFPLVGNGKYICRAIIFYAKVSQCKRLSKITYISSMRCQKEKENFCPVFTVSLQ